MADLETTKKLILPEPEPTLEELKTKAAAFDRLWELLKAARDEYFKEGTQDQRARNALKKLGIIGDSGKRESRRNADKILHEYENLIVPHIDWDTFRMLPPISKREAAKQVSKKYFESYEAFRQYVKLHQKKRKYPKTRESILPPA
jgi:hypothetical protein